MDRGYIQGRIQGVGGGAYPVGPVPPLLSEVISPGLPGLEFRDLERLNKWDI